MSRILVIRFSALGDVAMTIPVIASFAAQYPQHEIIVLTRKGFGHLFGLLNGNIKTIEADFKGVHAGIGGLFGLFWEIRKIKPDFVADLHAVIRTYILNILFIVFGIKTKQIRKGRIEKRNLTRKHNKIFRQLPSTIDRYIDVFHRLGFEINKKENIHLNLKNTTVFNELVGIDKKLIGIAPFAKHQGKIYPIEKMKEVIRLLSAIENVRIILFGGGKKEIELLDKLQMKYPNTVSVAGKFSLEEELQLMSKLNVILTMDSANMHLAALVDIPVISVWGATHSFSGFGHWKMSANCKVEINLDCRPCSVYGNKPCYRDDMACMHNITPEMIVDKLKCFIR